MFDTSALISLGAIKIIDEILKIADIIITDSIIKELEDFARHDDQYVKASKEVLKHKSEFDIKKTDIKESIEYIEKTDNEIYKERDKIIVFKLFRKIL